MVSFEQTRIVLERENIFALSVYPALVQNCKVDREPTNRTNTQSGTN